MCPKPLLDMVLSRSNAANLGVLVEEPVELTTQSAAGMLWWVVGALILTLMVTVILVVIRRRHSA